MIYSILKSSLAGLIGRASGKSRGGTEYPAEYLRELSEIHQQAPLNTHYGILYKDVTVGSLDFYELFERCLRDSQTQVSPWKAFRRAQGAFNLAQYFLYSLDVDGARAECGVFMGFSALLMCRAAKTKLHDFSGAGFYLVDSFEGLSSPSDSDLIPVRDASKSKTGKASAFLAGAGQATLEHARSVLGDFPDVQISKGWIPEVFATLPVTRWSFVHIDVDLYDPTLSGLEYFYPRMSPGGVIICDDYGALLFPGARKAWDEFCKARDIVFVVLDTGQSVILKE